MKPRFLVVVLHDVAPARWAGCRRVLAQVERVARQAGVELKVSLLVVPNLHGAPATPGFVRWLRRLSASGHELVLHGWTHRDESPAVGGFFDHALRRWYTAGEGEFAALTQDQAAARLALGKAWAQRERLPMRGFVAPAWLLSAAAWDAVAEAGFDYTCTLTQIVSLPERHALHARSLVFSTRSGWRRLASVAWNAVLGRWQRDAPLLRLELHPADADHALIRRCWSRLLAQGLRDRRWLRLAEAAALARPAGAPIVRSDGEQVMVGHRGDAVPTAFPHDLPVGPGIGKAAHQSRGPTGRR